MNELAVKEIEVENLIYEIRGKQVMLDSDLARLYECANGTKSINLAVNRNKERFPNDFYFQLTEEEYKNISRFQFETLKGQGHNIKYLPYVFTEQGVAMLATILRTEVAAKVSISIMRAFVKMRHYVNNNLIEQKFINKMVIEHDNSIKLLQESFDKLSEKKKETEIYFNGQIYDARSKILEIFKESKKELIIIDSYADNTLLDIIKRLKVKVIVITRSNNLLTNDDIKAYNKQYNNLKVIYNNTFHDRYFVLDKKEIYHCGASINRIGYKTFCINLINDENIKELLLNEINNLK